MDYIISASTDIGLKKKTNQDSLTVKKINTLQGKMVFALLCDGMGGLAKGEVASSEIVEVFNDWVENNLPHICESQITEQIIKMHWEGIVKNQNERIRNYGTKCGINLGTTVVALLITEQKYFLMNIGDSRAYEISDNIVQLTKDQTLIQQEIDLGNLTHEQAKQDPRRSVLLQCVGASEEVTPDFICGDTIEGVVYMLCSDGFRHEITSEEIRNALQPDNMISEEMMKRNMDYLIELNKERMEQDNISVITIRTF